MLDPRRFTPTLHASLVSEILSLRRELDSKHKFIEDLETSFDTVRKENDTLTSQLSTSTREGRAVKGQLQQLENATLSALEEIAGERDKLKEANEDLKDKLNAAQKKLRCQEDDSTRVHDMWAHEKEAWAGEKRTLERRIHISESRLKMILEEIAIHEEGQENDVESEGEGLPRDSGVGPDSEAGSVRSSPVRRTSTRIARHSRNVSNSSFRSFGRGYRMSLMSGTGSEGHGRNNGMSLADELVFDEEEEDLDDLELDSDDFPEHEMRALRALESRQSMRQDDKAKRILGLSLDSEFPTRDIFPDAEPVKSLVESTRSSTTVPPQTLHLVFPPPRPQSMEIPKEEPEPEPEPEPVPRPQYVDTGVQPSPPPSPVRPESSESAMTFKLYEGTASRAEVEANQRKKRVSATSSPLVGSAQPPPMPRLMTSTSTQSSDQPLSPPATPKVDTSFDDNSLSTQPRPAVASIATQTEHVEPIEFVGPVETPAQEQSKSVLTTRAPPPGPILIPSIAIHAPSSTPSSPKEPILPPGTISVATQTTIDLRSNMRTVGMQTEPIMVERRFNKLPPHLQPSAISSKPGTPEPGQKRTITSIADRKTDKTDAKQAPKSTAVPSARQDLMSLLENATDKIEDRYPGNNDNGPLTRNKESSISRPFRTSSLFAGFEGPSSDEEDSDAELSADEQHPPPPMLSARNVKSGKVFNNPPTPVPEEKEPSPPSARPSGDSARSPVPARASMEKPVRIGKLTRQASIRRSAMIQNGTSAHMRSRSPSIGSVDTNGFLAKPPFPVPTRSSSRKPVVSKSEGSHSPSPRNSGTFVGRRPYGVKQQHQRKDSLRKVRSAAVVSRSARPRSRSPPLPATPTTVPLSPSLPPIPTISSDVSSSYGYARGHRHQLSTTTTQTAQTALTGSASAGSSAAYQASVVDAIAATMVGEWMWKYVRGRRAFGGQESPADLARAGDEAVSTINGVRHKRWVWISPYERSVLWSNKQPTTGPALMGTKGRKRKFCSVRVLITY